MFAHLHVHTQYSLLDGACKIAPLVRRAKELGQTALAITDHGVMYGAVDFYKACKNENIKPIIGCEVYVAARSLRDKTHDHDSRMGHLLLLAKNDVGYKNLIRMVSLAFIDGFYYKPRIDYALLAQHSEGLIGLSACLAGDIAFNLLNNNKKEAQRLAASLKNIFEPNSFFLELQDHGLPEQKKLNPLLIQLSENLNLPLVATNDVHYISRQDADLQDILLCIQTKKQLSDQDRMRFSGQEFYLKSEQEMSELFPYVPQALSNTQLIADMCDFDFDFGARHLPQYKVPVSVSPAQYLRQLCFDGLTRYSEITPQMRQRLDYELNTIETMGFVDYFLIVWDFVRFAKSSGIFVGPGRGSGAGSLAAYCLKITDVDPIKYNLIFERFLNPERVSMPDFDIDFCFERRGEVIDYVVQKYGSERVAQIITFGTLAARGAVRDVGRVLGVSLPYVDKMAKLIPMKAFASSGGMIKNAIAESDKLEELYKSDEIARRVLDIASELEGLPRNCSTHAAGVVISKQPIDQIVPLAQNDKNITTQFPMTTIEELGLLKMDFLGLRTLTAIRDTISLCKENNIIVDLDNLDYSNPKVYKLIAAGDTDGVFQLESRGMKQFMTELAPTCLEDIIAGISLYRPGPMDSIPKYIKNKNNPSLITYKTPLLKDILDVTYGCIVYQEQVMMIVQTLAGYTLGQADILRRAMSKKKSEVMSRERDRFVEGAVKNGVDIEAAHDIFGEMAEFAKYAFNKSHAAAYAVLAYQTAYLKTFYPAQFIAALVTSVQDSATKIGQYNSDCKRLGIKLLPPCVNRSNSGFFVEGADIRFGLSYIKNVGKGFVEHCLAERQRKGPFKSFTDFIERVNSRELNKRPVEALIQSGAFDFTGAKRSQLLAMSELMLKDAAQMRHNATIGQLSLFDDNDTDLKKDVLPNIAEFDKKTILAREKEVVGVYLSGHPLDSYQRGLGKCDKISEIIEWDETSDAHTVNIGGMVIAQQVKLTKNGDKMAFITIEDMSGEIEVLVFPKTFRAFGELLSNECVIVEGRFNYRDEQPPVVIAQTIKTISPDAQEYEIEVEAKQLDKIRDYILDRPGEFRVVLIVDGQRYETNHSFRATEQNKQQLSNLCAKN